MHINVAISFDIQNLAAGGDHKLKTSRKLQVAWIPSLAMLNCESNLELMPRSSYLHI